MENFEKEQISEETKEKIVKGKGIEAISEIGWEQYRKELKNISYSDIIEEQIKQIEQLKSQPAPFKTGKTPDWIIYNLNAESAKRAKALAKNFINKYPQESVSSFSVFETNKKLTIVSLLLLKQARLLIG